MMNDSNNNTLKKELDKRDLSRLVDYYRMRVEAFERERVQWLEKLEGLRLNHEENHRMEWENRRRTDEVMELQNALSESNVSLNHDRKQIIHLTHELENLKLKSKDDRRRLVQMLQLAEPIEQTIKLYYDRRPEKLEKLANFEKFDQDSVALNKSLGLSTGSQSNYFKSSSNNNYNQLNNLNKTKSLSTSKRPNTSSSKIINKNNYQINKNYSKKTPTINNFNNNINIYSPKLEYRIPHSDEKTQIIRTILLPNDDTDQSIKEENEFLKKQLNEMQNLYETQIINMEEDRRLREEEIRLRELNFKEKLEELIKKNQKLDKLNYGMTKDYMELKYESSTNEKKLYEELEIVKLQNEALSVSIKDLINRTNTDKEMNKNDYEKKTKEITHVMRSQVKTQEENNNIIKEQYKQIQKIYTGRVKELEDKLKSLNEKYKNLESKRNLEIEGYINEIVLIRKRLKSYEEYIVKIRNSYYDNPDEISKKMGEMNQTGENLSNLGIRLKQDMRLRNSNNSDIRDNPSMRNETTQNNYNNSNNYSQEEEDRSVTAMEDL